MGLLKAKRKMFSRRSILVSINLQFRCIAKYVSLKCERLLCEASMFLKNSVKIVSEENLIKWQRLIDGRQLSSSPGICFSQQNIESSTGHAMGFLREMYWII